MAGHRQGSAAPAAGSATERTPLLETSEIAPAAEPLIASPSARDDNDGGHDTDQDQDTRPLPARQVFWLCFARLVEPMAFFSIFPYINKMAQDNGQLADTDVGFYSGLIESLFSLTQAAVMVLWGRAADRTGRKPVLVASLIGVSIATSVFGTARTLWQMILFRCLAGVFAGTIVTIRTMLSELSTSRTQAKAFSWFAFSGNLGILLGPVLGGALADPAHQYPTVFGRVPFFDAYPYALSSFVIAVFGLVAAATTAFYVHETLPPQDRSCSAIEDDGNGGGDDDDDDDDTTAPAHKPDLTIRQLLASPGVATVLYVYSHIMLLAFAYTAICPVFMFTPVHLGGFGLLPYQISILMAINGAAQAFWLLILFPPLQHRYGTNAVLRGCAAAYPFFFAMVPLGNLVLRSGPGSGTGNGTGNGTTLAFWILIPPVLALGSGVSMSFTAIQLALNDVAPPDQPRVLGTLNALALTGVSLVRAVAPALFTSLFALGARGQWLGGCAIWVLMVVLGAWFIVVARWLPEKDDEGKNARAGSR
ncbi:major facilitator superfamily transporter [Coniella lustricola]|uniref:Major facilitator superfamily transporter n=1 Tax=Coniella lustricola TaxID=2025994 RepID=A0A2T3A940_9PEZI|nr:major facilitator superfamily transporter [Coniella lustricola]